MNLLGGVPIVINCLAKSIALIKLDFPAAFAPYKTPILTH